MKRKGALEGLSVFLTHLGAAGLFCTHDTSSPTWGRRSLRSNRQAPVTIPGKMGLFAIQKAPTS